MKSSQVLHAIAGAVRFTVVSHTPVSLHALLLLDLPEDRRRRRLRDQHHGHREIALGARPQIRQRVSRARSRQGRRAGHALARPPAFLR